MGLIWILVGILVLAGLLFAAVHYISEGGPKDIHNPVVWIIIIAIFTPISLGLVIFGWYALRREYDRLPVDSRGL